MLHSSMPQDRYDATQTGFSSRWTIPLLLLQKLSLFFLGISTTIITIICFGGMSDAYFSALWSDLGLSAFGLSVIVLGAMLMERQRQIEYRQHVIDHMRLMCELQSKIRDHAMASQRLIDIGHQYARQGKQLSQTDLAILDRLWSQPRHHLTVEEKVVLNHLLSQIKDSTVDRQTRNGRTKASSSEG